MELLGYTIFDVFNMVVWGFLFLILLVQLIRAMRIVPAQKAYIVERLGKYKCTLDPGFHLLIPFLDTVAFIQDLREESITVPPQECFTSDNVQVEVDGMIYISLVNPVKASYGVTDYRTAAIQLSQTTTRSVIGTLNLDRTFEERDLISSQIINVLADAGEAWGIRVHRYEVKNIVPPPTVKNAMELQVTAERERRAIVARSEGEKQSRINRSEGLKMELINKSEGEMQRRINEAEGKAKEIRAIAEATANSVEVLGQAINARGGEESVRLQLSLKYLTRLSSLANDRTHILLPVDLTRVEDLLASLGLRSDSAEGK
ncbi:MAG: SPFH domain-containing protein [SAR324 cluster bacterium]|nr:SPFH domain-containing protein [SAR324 cluster bacterium]